MEKLANLVLKGNQLSSLEGLNVPELTKLDLSGNKLDVENPNIPELRHLGQELKKMRSIKIEGNTTENLRLEIVLCAPQVKKVDDEEVTQEDKQSAKTRKAELVELVKEYEEKKAAEGEKDGEDDG